MDRYLFDGSKILGCGHRIRMHERNRCHRYIVTEDD